MRWLSKRFLLVSLVAWLGLTVTFEAEVYGTAARIGQNVEKAAKPEMSDVRNVNWGMTIDQVLKQEKPPRSVNVGKEENKLTLIGIEDNELPAIQGTKTILNYFFEKQLLTSASYQFVTMDEKVHADHLGKVYEILKRKLGDPARKDDGAISSGSKTIAEWDLARTKVKLHVERFPPKTLSGYKAPGVYMTFVKYSPSSSSNTSSNRALSIDVLW